MSDAPPEAKAPGPLRFLPIALLVAGLGLFFYLDLDRFISLDALTRYQGELTAWVAANPVTAPVLYALAYALLVAFSVPAGALATILGGFLFGTFAGTAFVVVGATLGAVLVFIAARTAFGDLLRARAAGVLKRMEEGFRENAFNYLLVLRLVPLFPFFVVNIAPAFLGVKLAPYTLATFLGIIPGSFVYASIGNGAGALLARGEALNLGVIFEPAVLVPLIGLSVLALIPVVYKQWRARRAR